MCVNFLVFEMEFCERSKHDLMKMCVGPSWSTTIIIIVDQWGKDRAFPFQ